MLWMMVLVPGRYPEVTCITAITAVIANAVVDVDDDIVAATKIF